MLKCCVKTLVNKKNFSSLIMTNMELRFGAMFAQLHLEVREQEIQKKEKTI